MIASFVSKFCTYRSVGALVLFILAAAPYGCGPSVPDSAAPSTAAGKPLKELSPDQLYRWEGEGAAKHKVDLSRKERMELRQKVSETAK